MKYICDSATRLNVSSQGELTAYFCCREQCVSTQLAVGRKSGRTPLMTSGDCLPTREGMACTNSKEKGCCDYTLVKNCLFGEQMSEPILILSDETPSVRSRIERSRVIAVPLGDRFARRVSLPYDKSLAI